MRRRLTVFLFVIVANLSVAVPAFADSDMFGT